MVQYSTLYFFRISCSRFFWRRAKEGISPSSSSEENLIYFLPVGPQKTLFFPLLLLEIVLLLLLATNKQSGGIILPLSGSFSRKTMSGIELGIRSQLRKGADRPMGQKNLPVLTS